MNENTIKSEAGANPAITEHHEPASGALPKLVFSLDETRQIIDCSPATIYRMVARKKIRPCGGTRHLKFTMEEIQRFLRTTTEEAA